MISWSRYRRGEVPGTGASFAVGGGGAGAPNPACRLDESTVGPGDEVGPAAFDALAVAVGFFVVGVLGGVVGGIVRLVGIVGNTSARVVGLAVGIVAKISARVVEGASVGAIVAIVAIVVVSRSSVTPGPVSMGFHGT